MSSKSKKHIYITIAPTSDADNEIYIGNNETVAEILADENRKFDIVYLDPPYNAAEFEKTEYKNQLPDTIWLKHFRKTLSTAKELLSDIGVIFISINDMEVAEARIACHEIFGKQNFMAQIVRKRVDAIPTGASAFARVHEYLLVFAIDPKNVSAFIKSPISTWWDDCGYDNDAREDIANLFGECVFDYAKPVELMKKILSIFDRIDLNVLDMYAGSGTTAQAIMDMNHDDGGKRRFTLIQRNEIYNGRDIAEICTQRVELAINKYDAQTGCVIYRVQDAE